MALFVFRRVVTLIISLFIATLIIFSILEILPGDPASLILGIGAQADTLASLRTEMGLDLPPIQRYLNWIYNFISGDFGNSYTYDVPVISLIEERVFITVPLALFSILITTFLAIPLGVLAASKHKSYLDSCVMWLTQLGLAVPNFWFAILLILLFSVNLGWFSSGGFSSWESGFWLAIKSLLLPAISLALPQSAILVRVTRSSVLESLSEDFVRTARAKGLSKRAALWKHAFRNAMIPVLTIMGLQFSFLLSGTIIIENVFYLPGLGRLLFQAISQRDLMIVKNVILLLVVMVIFINFVVDLLYAFLDPRLKYKSNA